MSNIKQSIEALEEQITENSKENFRSLTAAEKGVLVCLDKVKTDYIAFMFGFISAIATDEFMGIFGLRIMDDVWGFGVSCCNVMLFGISSLFMLRLSVAFSGLKSTFSSKRTPTAGFNALLNSFDDTRRTIDDILVCIKTVTVVCCAALAVNLFRFISINMM